MKAFRIFKWFCLAVVKPCIIAALVINGIPPTIRAVSYGITSVVREFRGKKQPQRKSECRQKGQKGSASEKHHDAHTAHPRQGCSERD